MQLSHTDCFYWSCCPGKCIPFILHFYFHAPGIHSCLFRLLSWLGHWAPSLGTSAAPALRTFPSQLLAWGHEGKADDTTKPGFGHLIPDRKGHHHVTYTLLPGSNRSNIFDGLALSVKVLYQSRPCVSSLPPGRKLAWTPTISPKSGTIN